MTLDYPDVTREGDADRWESRVHASLPKGRMLDTSEESVDGRSVLPTAYHPSRLLATDGERLPAIFELLQRAARGLGWRVEVRTVDDEPADPSVGRAPEREDAEGNRLPAILLVTIHPDDEREDIDDTRPQAVDAWRLLTAARRLARRSAEELPLTGIGLDHVLTIAPYPGPIGSSSPDMPTRLSGMANLPGPDSYKHVGAGGRQVVDFVGPRPMRHEPSAPDGRRPVIAYFDTGCGRHPWLDQVVTTYPAGLNGRTIGFASPTTDPELSGNLLGKYDGFLDPFAGHGTFVAGILRQTCPDADILSIRITDGSGTLFESVFLGALRALIDWVMSDDGAATSLDVLSLSLGFCHETPTGSNFDAALGEMLSTLRRLGCAVVCSAGNDSFNRPVFPAALWEWPGSDFSVGTGADSAPHLSVGALNPARDSVALFSNFGPWVSLYAPGVSVVSTSPGHQGGVQAGSVDSFGSLVRRSLDPDDFRGGFAIGSGTSFAAPFIAGRLAEALSHTLMHTGSQDTASRITTLRLAAGELMREFAAPTE